MRCTIRIDDLSHMRAGDMIPWQGRPLRLTCDPEWTDGQWQAHGTWESYDVRITQQPGDTILVWHDKPRKTPSHQSFYR